MKINLTGKQRIYVAHGETDMRLSIDGLATLVQEYFQLDPFSSDLFLFCNRSRDKVKILHWDHNGFWLYYRRLENGKFQWPDGQSGETTNIDVRQFRWLLEGLTVEEGKVYPKINAKKIV